MSRNEVEVLVELLDSAFQRPIPDNWSDGWHSLLSNLRSVREEDWDWLPADGVRTIRDLASHCGRTMRVYAYYGFDAPEMHWGEENPPAAIRATKELLTPWLVESYETLRDTVAKFNDDQLDDPRETWDEGDFRPRRWFVTTMIDHLLYHAGEINHIRALAQKNDE
ncbi:MAG: DinB family protein [Chloroflexota bacterium]